MNSYTLVGILYIMSLLCGFLISANIDTQASNQYLLNKEKGYGDLMESYEVAWEKDSHSLSDYNIDNTPGDKLLMGQHWLKALNYAFNPLSPLPATSYGEALIIKMYRWFRWLLAAYTGLTILFIFLNKKNT